MGEVRKRWCCRRRIQVSNANLDQIAAMYIPSIQCIYFSRQAYTYTPKINSTCDEISFPASVVGRRFMCGNKNHSKIQHHFWIGTKLRQQPKLLMKSGIFSVLAFPLSLCCVWAPPLAHPDPSCLSSLPCTLPLFLLCTLHSSSRSHSLPFCPHHFLTQPLLCHLLTAPPPHPLECSTSKVASIPQRTVYIY